MPQTSFMTREQATERLAECPFPSKVALDTFKQSERAFQAQVVRYAELMGWRVWHDRATNAPRACKRCKARLDIPRNDPGFPDLVLIRRPRVVWLELKGQRTPITDDQLDWIAALRACGQEAAIVRPSDWRAIEDLLR